ncbi:unnamed protein product [Auanema sp. JU1783]|nr:unnamed protein product [Auanema sp. JU1783]
MIVGDNLFTHTWSLAVEIQFYLIVPFIYLSERILGTPKSAIFIPGLAVCSFVFYICVDEDTSFNFVFSRLWQFLAGYLTYLKEYHRIIEQQDLNVQYKETVLTSKNQGDSRGNVLSLILFMALLIIGLVPQNYQSKICFFRPCVTLMCSLWIAGEGGKERWVISLWPLVYLGDVSYILYLVHYPVYVFLNLHALTSEYWRTFGLLFAVVSSALLHHYFEKEYLKWNSRSVFTFITFLYISIILIVVHDQELQEMIYGRRIDYEKMLEAPDNYTLKEIVAANDLFNVDDRERLKHSACSYTDGEGPFGECEVRMNSSEEVTAMVIGNSYAPNMFRIVLDSCHKNFNKIIMKSYPVLACEPLWKTKKYRFDCSNAIDELSHSLRQRNPDYLFILSRHISLIPHGFISRSVENKKSLIVANILEKYVPFVKKKIFILDAFPRPKAKIGELVNAYLLENHTKSIPIHVQQTYEMKDARWQSAHRVLEQAMKQCQKCTLISINSFLSNKKNQFQFVNETNGLLYFVNNKHLSPYGLKTVQPLFKDICNHIVS